MRIVFAAIFFVLATSAAIAERRVALLFGADRYELIRPLSNAVNDARAVEEALDALGFEVFYEANRNLIRMRRALDDFAEDAAGADVALVFFAGHGVEIAGENRLLPTDADTASLAALKASSLPLEELRQTVARVAKVGLIMLDACRNDPFGTISDPEGRGATALTLPDTIKPGLGRMGRAENTLFAFSAAPGETAADGDGENSPFTTALTKYLGTEGLEIRSVLTLVQQEVYDRSRGKQLPYVESGLPSLFFASETSDKLPERERLLLAMADVTPEIRSQVEQIATDADMPLAPLYGALISSDIVGLNPKQREEKLKEAASSFAKVRGELRTLKSSDTRVASLRSEAEQHVLLGAFNTARAKLLKAAEIDSSSRETLKSNYIERTLSEAVTYYLGGGTARAELRYEMAITDFQKASSLFAEVDFEDISEENRLYQIRTLDSLGSVYLTTGNLSEAGRAYFLLLEVIKNRADTYPENLGWRHELSTSYNKLGDIAQKQGKLSTALEYFEDSLSIRSSLAESMPDNATLQRSLSLSYENIGDIQFPMGNLSAAINSYRSAIQISENLTTKYPENTQWQRDLSVAYNKIGDAQVAQGDLSGASEAYEFASAIRKRLTELDPGNTKWRRDLSVSQEMLGNVRMLQSRPAVALEFYQSSLTTRKHLVETDPENRLLKRGLSVALNKVGDAHVALSNLQAALGSYSDSLEISADLVAQDPGNTVWQRDLSVSYESVANVHWALGNILPAMAHYAGGKAIAETLTELDPDNAAWQRELSLWHARMGDIGLAMNVATAAFDSFSESMAIAERLVEHDPQNADWRRDLSIWLGRIGDTFVLKGEKQNAFEYYSKSLEIKKNLASADPGNASLQRDLIINYHKLAKAGFEPHRNFERALAIATSMKNDGILLADDEYIIDAIRNQLSDLAETGR